MIPKRLTLADSSRLVDAGEAIEALADDPGPGAECVLCVNGEPWYTLSADSRILVSIPERAEVSLMIRKTP